MLKKYIILITGILLISFVFAYTPPAYNKINLVLKSNYVPPTYNNINLVLGTATTPSTCWSYDSSTKRLYIPSGCTYYLPNGQVGYL